MSDMLLDIARASRDAFLGAPTNIQIAVVVLALMLLSRRGRALISALLTLPFWIIGLLLRTARAALRYAGTTRAQRVRAEWDQLRPTVAPKILERDNWTCQERKCRTPLTPDNWTIDHVIPVSRGGTNSTKNLRACCRPCNSSKGARV